MSRSGVPGWSGAKAEARNQKRKERMRYVLLIVGGLIALMGLVWLLQGVGVLLGSFMTGQTFWAIVGAIMLAIGGILVFAGFRLNRRR